jgi:Carbohydrate binding domain/Right handed beta helix region
MKKRSITLALIASILILSLAALLVKPQVAHAATTWWYVDCSVGSNGTGTSPSSPWNTLTSVSAHTFQAGDGLIFAESTTCNGQLALKGSGASGNPIVIGAWNHGHGSANPILAGGGVSPATVYLHDNQYVTVEDLQVTNSRGSAGDRVGILAYNDTSNTLNGITITANTVDNVNGYLWGYYGVDGGIAVDIDGGLARPGVYNGVSITNNNVWNVDRVGIWVGSLAENGAISARSTGITISGNQMTALGADGIVVRYTSGARILNNLIYNAGNWTGGTNSGSPTYNNPASAAIWPVNSTSPIVQGNEVYGYVSQDHDGEAYDCDLYTTNCLMQYNYSHNDVDGLWLDCSGAGGRGEVFRYNISQDDATAKNGTFADSCHGNPTPAVYNNTVYISSGSPNIDGFPNAVWGSGASFTNNIIDNQGSGYYSTNVSWNHTLFYGSGNRPSNDTNAVVGNPKFSNPNGGGNGLGSGASAYALTSGSAALAAGVGVSGAPSKDYNNNNICGTPNIGAMDNLCGTGSSNRVSNPGFETGSLSPWISAGTASVVSNNAHTGSYAVQTGNSDSGVNQTISGLASSHTYTLTGWVKSSNSSDAIYVGVKNYGGAETNNSTTSSTYTRISITFTTGSSNTSAQIYCWKNGGSAASYCDDFSVS